MIKLSVRLIEFYELRHGLVFGLTFQALLQRLERQSQFYFFNK